MGRLLNYTEDGGDIVLRNVVLLQRTHGIITQKILLFITTAVGTSDATKCSSMGRILNDQEYRADMLLRNVCFVECVQLYLLEAQKTSPSEVYKDLGARGSVAAKVLCYKPEGREFETR
jgi:hypothetical protein